MVRFFGSKSRKFPVIFPVSREFGRRKVSARLRAPPRSLHCREFLPLFPAKCANMPVFSDFCATNRTAENGLVGIECSRCPGFSLEGTCAVRFQGARKAK